MVVKPLCYVIRLYYHMEADRMSDEQFGRLAAKVFKGAKTAAQIVAEGRER